MATEHRRRNGGIRTQALNLEINALYRIANGEIRKVLHIGKGDVIFVSAKGTLVPGWDAGPLRTLTIEAFLADKPVLLLEGGTRD